MNNEFKTENEAWKIQLKMKDEIGRTQFKNEKVKASKIHLEEHTKNQKGNIQFFCPAQFTYGIFWVGLFIAKD